MILFVPTAKNLRGLSALGLQVADVLRIIAKLEPLHWHSGPNSDRDGSKGEVFVFMYPRANILLYIKLKVQERAEGTHLIILSFHEEGQHGAP